MLDDWWCCRWLPALVGGRLWMLLGPNHNPIPLPLVRCRWAPPPPPRCRWFVVLGALMQPPRNGFWSFRALRTERCPRFPAVFACITPRAACATRNRHTMSHCFGPITERITRYKRVLREFVNSRDWSDSV